MWWLDLHPIILQTVTFVFGIFSGLVVGYLKIYLELAFIKGQLSEVLKHTQGVVELSENHAKLEIRIKILETRIKGDLYEFCN